MYANQGGFYAPQFGTEGINPFVSYPESKDIRKQEIIETVQKKQDYSADEYFEGNTAREVAKSEEIFMEEQGSDMERLHKLQLLIEQERSLNSLRVQEFEHGVEKHLEELKVKENFEFIDKFLEQVGLLLEEQDLDLEIGKAFDEQIYKLASRFQKDFQPVFVTWAEEQSKETKSWLANMRRNFVFKYQVSLIAKRLAKELEKLDLQLKMRKSHLMNSVIARFNEVLAIIQQMSEKPDFSIEEVFKEFLIAKAWDGWRENSERKPGFFEKIVGKKQTSLELEFKVLLGRLSNEYGGVMDEFGVTKRDKIEGTVSAKDLQPNKSGSRPKKKAVTDMEIVVEQYENKIENITEILDGEQNHFQDEQKEVNAIGLEKYMQEMHLSVAFQKAVEALGPILGRDHFVIEIKFVTDVSAINPNYAGVFSKQEKRIELYKSNCLTAEVVKTMCHESGHAMCLDRSLSLREAIQFNVEIIQSIMRSGFVSGYSAMASNMYFKQLTRAHGMAVTMDKGIIDQIEDSTLEEEWAEMFGYAMVSSVSTFVAPEKVAIVKKYLAKFGVDFDDLRAVMSGDAAGYDEPILEQNRVLASVLMNHKLTPEQVREELVKLNLV